MIGSLAAVELTTVALISFGVAIDARAASERPPAVAMSPIAHVSAAWPDAPHVETHVAINPANPANLIAVAMAFPHDGAEPHVVAYHSHDSGATWARASLPDAIGADPWVAFTPNGDALLAHLPGVVHRSTDSGRTFERLAEIPRADGPYDFCKLIANSEGQLFFVASQSMRNDDGARIAPVAVSVWSEADASFSPPAHHLPRAIDYQIGPPAVEDDRLLIPYYELSQDGALLEDNPIRIAFFDAANATFNVSSVAGDGAPYGLARSPRTGRLHHLFASPDDWILRHNGSDDGGDSWSPAQPIPGAEFKPREFTHAAMAIDAEGVIAVAWVKPRAIGDDAKTEHALMLNLSYDDGETFSEPILVSDGFFASVTPANSATVEDTGRPVHERYWAGGDYLGLAALPSGDFLLVWADSRTGVFQAWSRRVDPTP